MKASVYMRVSTEEQRDRQTIENQREAARHYAALHEIGELREYSDDGITGTLPLGDRPAGRRLLDDARQGKLDTLFVYKLDRLGRDPRLILNAVHELESLGVQIKSMTEPFDTSTPAGRFMLTMMSGVAGLERETILQRTHDGTMRRARDGAWLGGIVPYGYRVEGIKREAHLVIADDPLPGLDLSEADVIRLVYRLAVDENMPCSKIARHLNLLGVPPSYAKDGRAVGKSGRSRKTSGQWWPGRINKILRSSTYKGVHQYGSQSKNGNGIIEREVPAIVEKETWERAQQVLDRNRTMAKRSNRHRYLLRGLIRCGLCGSLFGGSVERDGRSVYYSCNSRRRAVNGNGHRCRAKSVRGDIEDIVWADIETFLRNPGPVLKRLADQMDGIDSELDTLRRDAVLFEEAFSKKHGERDAILALYRRGRIDDATLDSQLGEIEAEQKELQTRLDDLRSRLNGLENVGSCLDQAEVLLRELNARLDSPLTWEMRREIVEILVAEIAVNTINVNSHSEVQVNVTYRFSEPPAGDSATVGREYRYRARV